MNFTDIYSEAISITVVGYGIVFFVLVLLYLVFFYMSKALAYQAQLRYERSNNKEEKRKAVATGNLEINGEISAAISLALHLHLNEQHDEESGKLTVKRVSKHYTPWNSKIYNVMNRL